jgi:hypothetical protein
MLKGNKTVEHTPFDLAAHEFLLALGYTYEYVPAYQDDGTPTSGPETWGHPASDVYILGTDGVVINWRGATRFTPQLPRQSLQNL